MAETKKDTDDTPQFPIDYKDRRMVYHTPLDPETNRPTDYIVAGTPGEPTIVGGAMLNYAGLAGKIVKGAKEGYDFLELDLWNDAEILEPHLAERIKQIRETHRMDLGIHLRINLDLTSALGPIWDVNHKSLVTGVLGATEVVKANFILMHSAATPILEFGEAAARTAPSTLVTPWKDNLASFIESPLCFDNETRKRLFDKETPLVPRLPWNIYYADEEGILDTDKRDKYTTQLKPLSEKNKDLPTLKDWAISKFVKDIWFPGTVPQAEVMVAIKDVETMREVVDSDKKAYELFEKWFDKDKGKWRNIIDNIIINKENKVKNIVRKYISDINNHRLTDPGIKDGIIQALRTRLNDQKFEKEKEEINNSLSQFIKEYDYFEHFNRNFTTDYKLYFKTILPNEERGSKPREMFYHFFNDVIDLFKKSNGEKVNNDKGEPTKSDYPFMKEEQNKEIYNDFINDLKDLKDIQKKNHVKIKQFYEHFSVAENFSYWIQKGAEGEEQIAYRTLAKWMYVIKDHLYEKIVIEDREVDIWWEQNKKDVEKHKKELFGDFNGTDTENKIVFLDPDNIIAYTNVTGGGISIPLRKLVAAVSAKYIQGHLDRPMETDTNLYLESSKPDEDHFKASLNRQLKNMRKDPNGGDNSDNMLGIHEYMYKEGVHFYIETQDVLQEEWRGKVRIMSLTDHIEIIKAFSDHYGFDNVSYTMDFEHLTSNLLNPRQQIEQLDKGDAKYLSMVHINPPSSVQGLHKILKKMSFDTEYIYGWLYKLKSLGMSGAYFVWEMGKDTGSGTYEAPLAIRAIAGELKKGTKPTELPEQFFGIDANFYAMQVQAIKAHGLDPIRDMFFYKPADFTFMGNMARATNAEIADKERLK
ncbi:MAG: hypothetical protein KAI18_00850 [Candidatus Aenigmarchaeota archaeon]|nr:hypothetical protein [Candidatus Aenigmarchaeota archaeon]